MADGSESQAILHRKLTPRLSDRERLGKPAVYVYSWGRGDFSQLGHGDALDRDTPAMVSPLQGKAVCHVAAGEFHTAFLTEEGEVYTVGNNEAGQLGIGGRESSAVPRQVAALDTRTVVHVACGAAHTVAVTDVGSLASWGSSDFGQLGLTEHGVQTGGGPPAEFLHPRIVKGSRELRFVRVACGANHTLALTGSGEVYSFGQGIFGALGHGSTADLHTPTQVTGLWGLGVVQLSCGDSHSAALTIDGQVFTWGRGKYGQLGLGHTANELRPAIVPSLTEKSVAQISCGGDHTMALTTEGSLLTWGRGHWGQTGHGTTEDQTVPKRVDAFIGEEVVQISAGVRHSLALVNKGLRMFGWGDGEQFQLGRVDRAVQAYPIPIQGLPTDSSRRLLFVVGGGEHSLAVYGEIRQKETHNSSRKTSRTSDEGDHTLMEVDEGSIENGESLQPAEIRMENDPTSQADDCLRRDGAHSSLTEQLHAKEKTSQAIETSEPAPNAAEESSFLIEKPSVAVEEISSEAVLQHAGSAYGTGLQARRMEQLSSLLIEARAFGHATASLMHGIEDVFSSAKFLVEQFKLNAPAIEAGQAKEGPGLHLERIKEVYQGLLELYDPQVLARLAAAMGRLLESVDRHVARVPDSRWTRAILVLLQNPLLGERGVGDAVSVRLCDVLAKISPSARTVLVGWLKTYPKDIFGGRFVRGLHRFISNREDALGDSAIPHHIANAVNVLSILYDANKEGGQLPASDFYSHSISTRASLKDEYLKWRKLDGEQANLVPLVSFCQAPFVLTPDAKSKILQGEAALEKGRHVRASVVQHVFGHAQTLPVLLITVRREALVHDALQQLAAHPYDLKKPLKVVFSGEDAVDEGGVAKEFFQLLIRDLFNVSYGMFVYDEESRSFWFDGKSMESELEFQLVGVALGLAIYNGIILDVHFPMAVYKKLVGETLGLEDLKEANPQLGRGLQKLLEFEGDVAAAMAQTFQVEYEYFGEMRTYDLLPDGGNTIVTNENRQRYVELYVNYVLDESVKEQFAAFSRGFLQVCGGPALSLFRAEELELLVCGLPHFDFAALQQVTHYEGGFTADSQVVKWFWELVHHMPLEDKKKLLFFSTGNDRSPIGGLGSLNFIVMRNGPDTDRLPTAHTCFNVLMLPEYSSKEKLEGRLKLAIQNATGFGLQ